MQLIHLVLDLDGTTLSRFIHGHVTLNLPQLSFNYTYASIRQTCTAYLHPGLAEFLQWMTQLPGIRLSFYSAGEKNFNRLTLSHLFTHIFGKDHSIQYEVFSRDCVDILGSGTTIKDLNRINKSPDEKLDHTLLVDDSALPVISQKRNLLRFQGAEQEEFIFHGPEDALAANHIFYLTGLLHQALDWGREDFLTHIIRLDKDAHSGTFDSTWKIYEDGMAVLRKINPQLNFYRNPNSLIGNEIKTTAGPSGTAVNPPATRTAPGPLTPKFFTPHTVTDRAGNGDSKIECIERDDGNERFTVNIHH